MDDLSAARPSMPSGVEKYSAGDSTSGGQHGQRKSPAGPAATTDKQETPEVETSHEQRHQLDERA
jgi:hypothetical protein